MPGTVKINLRDFYLRHATQPSLARRALATGAMALFVGAPIGILVGLLGPVLGGGAVVALGVAYVLLRSPLAALLAVLAVVFLLPFAALPIDIGFAPTFLDLTLGGAFVVWLSRVALHKDRELIAELPIGGMFAFATLAIFSFIIGLSHGPLTSTVLRRFAEIQLAIFSFVLVLNVVRTRDQLLIAAHGVVAGGAAAGGIGVLLYVLPRPMALRALNALTALRYPGGDVLRFIEDDPSQPLRAIGTSIDPNVLGGVLIFTTVLGVALLLNSEAMLPRWLLGAMVGLSALCLMLTFSRSAFVGLAVGVGLLGLLRYRKLIWFGAAVMVLIILLPQTQAYTQRLIEGFQCQDLAMKMRFGEYKDALTLIRRHPWIGVGFSGTPEIDTYLGVSSVYLLIAEEMGVIGLAAFLATMATFMVRFLTRCHTLKTDPLLAGIGYGTATAISGALVAGIADHYLFNLVFPHAALLLWTMLGLSAATLRIVQMPPTQANDRRHWVVRAFLPDRPPRAGRQ